VFSWCVFVRVAVCVERYSQNAICACPSRSTHTHTHTHHGGQGTPRITKEHGFFLNSLKDYDRNVYTYTCVCVCVCVYVQLKIMTNLYRNIVNDDNRNFTCMSLYIIGWQCAYLMVCVCVRESVWGGSLYHIIGWRCACLMVCVCV
jgi:hypothetical protein